ncbi:YadA-like family protein, partial [Burkholderia sp. MSMB1078WGS]|uniref:YadA-like family protein n=1 Tax=Burkholderia sp. MSMB1078WGS TaxID=1637900 RepID=UPI000A5B4923
DLSNVKAGKADMDAVNVSQLKSSGLVDKDGKALAAVTYDKNADGTPDYRKVTLGGMDVRQTVKLSNVATGVAGTDAVNVDQLTGGLDDLEDKLVNGAIDFKYIKVKSNGIAARAVGDQTVAIGAGANATNRYAMALGSGARATGVNSVAIGYNSVAEEADTIAVGSEGKTRRIVHVGEGRVDAQSTDAVNGSQLYAALDQINASVAEQQNHLMALKQTRDVSSKPGSFVAIEGFGDDGSIPNIASMNGRDPLSGTAAAIGVASAAAGVNAVAVGLQSVAGSDHSVGIGSMAQTGVDQEYSVAIGSMVTTNGVRAIAVGSEAKANGDNSVALGNNKVSAIGDSSVAVGDGAKTMVGARNSIAMGTSASVMQNVSDAMALGANASVTAAGAGGVALGAGSVANRGNALSIGSEQMQRQIVNVAKGTQGTDAVNLSQLKGVTDALGGGTTIAGDGTITAPSYKVGDKVYNNVGDALAAAGQGQGGTDPNAVAYDSAQKDAVTLAGADGTTLTNVKTGELSATSKDAVTGAQLFATNENLAGLQQSLKDGGVIDPTTGESLAVTYADATKAKATLAGAEGTILSNVKAGVADKDAVNVSQLKSSGLIGNDGKAIAAVTYDRNQDGTANVGSVTLGGMGAAVPVALHNVASGKISTDAVNVSQLTGVTEALGGGAGIDADGSVKAPSYTVGGKTYTNVNDALKAAAESGNGGVGGTDPKAVAYDDASKTHVTLGGSNGTVIGNVANGSLAADSTDAVNGAQMNAIARDVAQGLGGRASFDPVTGKLTAPTYELSDAKGGTTQYRNVGDAMSNLDERVSGNTTRIDSLQAVAENAVQYDDASRGAVSLGGKNAAAPVALKNVADGADDTDAVNVRQLRSAGLVGDNGQLQSAVVYDKHADGTTNYASVTLGGAGVSAPVALHNIASGKDSTDAVNVSQLRGVTSALGGGATIDPSTGKVIAPTYEIGGEKFDNAGAALTNIDNRVTKIQNGIGDSVSLAGAVVYDKLPEGTPNYGRVTLGNGMSSGPVVLTNVAKGTQEHDAVNFGQFSELRGKVDDLGGRIAGLGESGSGSGSSGGGTSGTGAIDVTGGSGSTSGQILAAKPGDGNGNSAAGSGAQVANGVNDGSTFGANSKVNAEGGTAVGQGASVASGATNAVAIGHDSAATEANTVSVGKEGAERRIVNIADGVKATDAVSKGQFDRAMGGMQGQINDLSRNAYSGIAAATALAMIPSVDPGKNISFGIGGASYKGYQAVSLGGEARITENIKMRAGVGLSSGGNTFGVGAAYQW